VQAGVEVILNAGSGASEASELRRLVSEQFAARGVEARVRLVRGGKQLAAAARGAAEGGAGCVVAAGGDGTINAVASALSGTGKSLGVLPVGTFNYFAKALGLPLDLEGAVSTIAAGHVAEVDVGEVNGRLFINNASIGLYPSIIRQREREYQRWGRRQLVAYAAVARTLLQGSPFMGVRLWTHGQELSARTPLIFVGANGYQIGEFDLPGGECVGRGELAVYVARPAGGRALPPPAGPALHTPPHGERTLHVICADEARVETRRRRIPVALDGEVVRLETPLLFKRRRAALKVCVPKEV
jgi:diacylglycerol kinase family enzyme